MTSGCSLLALEVSQFGRYQLRILSESCFAVKVLDVQTFWIFAMVSPPFLSFPSGHSVLGTIVFDAVIRLLGKGRKDIESSLAKRSTFRRSGAQDDYTNFQSSGSGHTKQGKPYIYWRHWTFDRADRGDDNLCAQIARYAASALLLKIFKVPRQLTTNRNTWIDQFRCNSSILASMSLWIFILVSSTKDPPLRVPREGLKRENYVRASK
jgi:hypothetical protein